MISPMHDAPLANGIRAQGVAPGPEACGNTKSWQDPLRCSSPAGPAVRTRDRSSRRCSTRLWQDLTCCRRLPPRPSPHAPHNASPASSRVIGVQALPWETTSLSIAGGQPGNSPTLCTPKIEYFSDQSPGDSPLAIRSSKPLKRSGTEHKNSHSSTGSASGRARSPAPNARAAISDRALHRGSPANPPPSSARVTTQPPCSSCPTSRSCGTLPNVPTQL